MGLRVGYPLLLRCLPFGRAVKRTAEPSRSFGPTAGGKHLVGDDSPPLCCRPLLLFCSLLFACLLPSEWKLAGGRRDRVSGGPPPWSAGCLSQAPGLWRPAASRGSIRSRPLLESKRKGRRTCNRRTRPQSGACSATRVENNPGSYYAGEVGGLCSCFICGTNDCKWYLLPGPSSQRA